MNPAVLDASALVALLLDAGAAGRWVAGQVAGRQLAAPELVMFETANVLRRRAAVGAVSQAEASLAHEDLRALALELWPYAVCAERAWQLRANLTVQDASYVAVAERLGADLLTLDVRLARAPGPRCRVATPPPAGQPLLAADLEVDDAP